MLGAKINKPIASNKSYSYLPPPKAELPPKHMTTVEALGKKGGKSPYEDPLNEEVDDENSVLDGSFVGNKKSASITNSQGLINETVRDTATDPDDAFKNAAGHGMTGISNLKNKNLSPSKDRATSAISKYSAVVFTQPMEKVSKKSKKKTDSDDDDYEDDFESEFEAYETEEEKVAAKSKDSSKMMNSA